MDAIIIGLIICIVIAIYFKSNPMAHSKKFLLRRFINWFPLGMTYAFLYMARYNLSVTKNALGTTMDKESFGLIFGAGTVVYGFSFLLNGPLVDKIGGKKGMLIAALGSSIANILMGVVTFLLLKGQIQVKNNLVLIFSILYSINMFFQSYGAVSIIKIKSYWFHVRERGLFGAIFGTLISVGLYLAFGWGQGIADAAVVNQTHELNFTQKAIRTIFAVDTGTQDAIWLVFFIPAFLLVIWALLDAWLLADTPADANLEDFDTHDASSDEMEKDFTMKELLVKIFTHPVLLTVAAIEFTSGVLRNGILTWYPIFSKEVPQTGGEFFNVHWGVLITITGVIGGFLAGWLSDHVFHSRRGPPAAIMNGVMILITVTMCFTLTTSPFIVGACAVLMQLTVIGVHSIMSGTAGADFGGRKASATASGITDGFVYLGTGLQSISLGYLTSKSWQLWPIFLVPFTIIGLVLALRIWKAIPEATRRYLLQVEKISLVIDSDDKLTTITTTIETKTEVGELPSV